MISLVTGKEVEMKNLLIPVSLLLAGVFCGIGVLLAQQQDQDSIDLPVDNLPEIKLNIEPPLGLKTNPEIPENNPQTDEKVALGRKLFFDPILSEDGKVACASCHKPDNGFAGTDPIAIGLNGRKGKRNAPSLLNKAYSSVLFWDGRTSTLEEQAIKPLSNENELSSDINIILKKLRENQEYVGMFESVFEAQGAEAAVTPENIGSAIASFERTLVMGNTQVDRFHAAEYDALSKSARQGMWIFESRGKCWKCHNGETFSDQLFHNTGVSFGAADRDLGRFDHTELDEDKFKFKTPSLRGIELTAPYMHDGNLQTLREVVEFYNKGGSPDDPTLSDKIEPLNLTEAEVDNLVEFLKALSK